MCGIIACRTTGPAIDYLRIALRRLEYRGYDSAGVAVRTHDGGIVRLRTVGRVAALDPQVSARTGPALDGLGIGHTRWATHGVVSEGNAHPHTDCTGQISLVHNGIVQNVERLRARLVVSGHSFSSDVDSEVLCHLIEDQRQLGGNLREAVEAALIPVEGSWALAVLEHATGQLVVAANQSPLLVAHTPHGDFAASDVMAIAEWAHEFRVLEDGEVLDLAGENSRNRQPASGHRNGIRCGTRHNDVALNGYSDYMAKEIDQQPEVVARTLDEVGPGMASGELWDGLCLPPFDRLHVIGCGTSLNAGNVIGNLVRSVGGLPVTSCVGSEVADVILEPGTLVLAVSQSGETADVLQGFTSGRFERTPVLAITNSGHSTLTRRSDATVLCGAGPEIGVAATKTFVCQVVTGVAVAISALVAMDRLPRSRAAELADDLFDLPSRLSRALTIAKCAVPPIAERMVAATGVVFIARGSGLPYAAEGALKLKELTYQWADYCPAGELKHGSLALISSGTPVVTVDNANSKLPANVEEIRARGGWVSSIGAVGSEVPVVHNPSAPWGPLESVVALQVLARTSALLLHRDVDKPRNLAKSVTVE